MTNCKYGNDKCLCQFCKSKCDKVNTCLDCLLNDMAVHEITMCTKFQRDYETRIDSINIVNGDGTSMDDYPKNPLKEKWDRLYPPIIMPQNSQVCDGYSCMWCGRCPRGEYWKVPEEDKEAWEAYQEEVHEYNVLHGNIEQEEQ